MRARKIDDMEAEFLPDERNDSISMNRRRHGLAGQKLANRSRDSVSQQPILSAIMIEIRMLFYDTIEILCLVYQISVKIKEHSKFIKDCTRNSN